MSSKANQLKSKDPFRTMPATPEELRLWLKDVMGIEISDRVARGAEGGAGGGGAGHASPLDYLWHAFHEEPAPDANTAPVKRKPDAVVWANRGGGKTWYAALATALDLVFKPGIDVKILAGSLEQSQRLFIHLRRLFEGAALSLFVDGKPTDKRIVLANGSCADILAQSQTSVRGIRPQKLRCDEVELFDPEIWEAAQFTPLSKWCGGVYVHGAIEAISTCHEPFGLMSEIVATCAAGNTDALGAEKRTAPTRLLFKWNVLDVMNKCEPARVCATCAIFPECAGRAKLEEAPRGHLPIDDVCSMKLRSGAERWETEMLCLRPKRSGTVFPEFDPSRHVVSFEVEGSETRPFVTNSSSMMVTAQRWLGGMDFGYRDPTVFLWAVQDARGALFIVDEYVRSCVVMDEHIRKIGERPWPKPAWIGIDPAGAKVNDHTGESSSTMLRKAGYSTRFRGSSIVFGLGAVRARLKPAELGHIPGADLPRLFIHPRCTRLIESLTKYHYPVRDETTPNPEKDGHDHAPDALRYLILNLDHPVRTENNCYLPGVQGAVG